MYSGIEKINEVIEFIENNILEDLDAKKLAAKMNLSVYEFRRIFSFVVGTPLSEYIRKRRLSLAACEILTDDKTDMLELSQKYGYSSQSAFIKAFGEVHGVTPTAILKEKKEINLFARPRFSLSVEGNETVPLKIIQKKEFSVFGLNAISSVTDTECCESVWNEFYEKEIDKIISSHKKCGNVFAVYKNDPAGSNVDCTIGVDTPIPGLYEMLIPECKWASFTLDSTDDDFVNRQYSKILYEWLPSAGLKRDENLPTVEIYPFDMSENNFNWEILIPLK